MNSRVTELLRNYKSYKYAVAQYVKHKPMAQAGVANYDAMPNGSGAPELFFTLNARLADMGLTSQSDEHDYEQYRRAVNEIEGALETLTDDEQSVIRLKWMSDVTLKDIAKRKSYSVDTIKRWHKSAINKLDISLRFTKVPEIEHHDKSLHFFALHEVV